MFKGLVLGLLASIIMLAASAARAEDGALDCTGKKKTCFADGGDANCICVDEAEYVPNPPELDPNADTGVAPADG